MREALAAYDVIGAVDVRFALRALEFDPGKRWLAELGPAQKSKQLNRQGRSLKITTALLVSGTCGISQPFGERAKLDAYLATGSMTKLLRRLATDAKPLHALYQYGRLHGSVRLRWGFSMSAFRRLGVHRDERTLYDDLKISAFEMDTPLEVVLGSAPGWDDPWARVQSVRVIRDGYHYVLINEAGSHVDDAGVQLAWPGFPPRRIERRACFSAACRRKFGCVSRCSFELPRAPPWPARIRNVMIAPAKSGFCVRSGVGQQARCMQQPQRMLSRAW